MEFESIDDFFQDFGESVTFTPEGGQPVTITAIVNDDFPRQEDYERGLNFAIAQLTVKSEDVQTPKARDRYDFRNHGWAIASDGYQNQDGIYLVNLVRILTD